MIYQLVGKQTFTSSKSGKTFTALHLIESKPLSGGDGHAVASKVMLGAVDIALGKVDITYNDRGFIENVKAI